MQYNESIAGDLIVSIIIFKIKIYHAKIEKHAKVDFQKHFIGVPIHFFSLSC